MDEGTCRLKDRIIFVRVHTRELKHFPPQRSRSPLPSRHHRAYLTRPSPLPDEM